MAKNSNYQKSLISLKLGNYRWYFLGESKHNLNDW